MTLTLASLLEGTLTGISGNLAYAPLARILSVFGKQITQRGLDDLHIGKGEGERVPRRWRSQL